MSTLFSALCCFGAQFTILSFSPPALLGAKRRTMYPPASCALFSHREGHIVRPPTYNPHNTLGIKLPRLANTFFCLSIPPRNSRGQLPRLSVSSKALPHNSKGRYGERGAAAAKPKAQIILDAAKVSAPVAETANRSRGSGRRVRGAFAPEARCGYRNPTLSSILATQMPCRSRRSGA